VRLTVEDILNWALLAGTSLDLYPIATELIRLNCVNLSKFIPVVSETLSELGSLMQPMFYGMRVDSHVLEYADGAMVVEVKNVIDAKQLTHYTP
jgi:hypothetical protein